MRVRPWFRAAAAAALWAASAAAVAKPPDLARVEKLVVEMTNAFRSEQGLEAAQAHAALEKAARRFAEHMASTDRYGHTADGKEPADRALAQGYEYCLVSENISYQFSSAGFRTGELATRYVEGWKGSPGHRKNMADAAATHIAVAVARSEKTGRYYAVQMFGRPKSAMVEFRITNEAREPAKYRVADKEFALAPGSARIHTQCGVEEVRLLGAREALRPRNGARFAIVREAGGRFAMRER